MLLTIVLPMYESAYDKIYDGGFSERCTFTDYDIEKMSMIVPSYDPECIEFYSPFRGITLPWVEGVEGYGIGESIEFDVKNGSFIYILNGYVDPSKPELFKANSRIKRAKLNVVCSNGEEEESTVEFEDFVYCKEVKCNPFVRHVKITIEEVYPGDKYDDTCITWIITNASFEI